MQLPLFVPRSPAPAPVAPLDILPPWRRAIAVDAAHRGVTILVSPPDIGELWPLPLGGATLGLYGPALRFVDGVWVAPDGRKWWTVAKALE